MSGCTVVCAKDLSTGAPSTSAEEGRPEVISAEARALLESVGRLRRSIAAGRALVDLYGTKPHPHAAEQGLLAPSDPHET